MRHLIDTDWVVHHFRGNAQITRRIDELGIGDGVVHTLNEMGLQNVIGVNGGTKSDTPERFVNRRAQLYYGLKQRFEDDDIAIPAASELISQLAALTHTYNVRGQLVLETKEKIRRPSLPQPIPTPVPFMYIPL